MPVADVDAFTVDQLAILSRKTHEARGVLEFGTGTKRKDVITRCTMKVEETRLTGRRQEASPTG